jgi:hypothetical protein
LLNDTLRLQRKKLFRHASQTHESESYRTLVLVANKYHFLFILQLKDRGFQYLSGPKAIGRGVKK